MDVNVNDQEDSVAKKKKVVRNARHDNPLNNIVIRTLICIIIIDLAIWGYFSIIGVSFVEGIEGWQQSMRTFMGLSRHKNTESNIIVKTSPQKIQNTYKPRENKSYEQESKNIKTQLSPSLNNKISNQNKTDDQIHDIEIKTPYIGDPNGTIYSWKDESGKIHYSNNGFPGGNIEKLWVRKKIQ